MSGRDVLTMVAEREPKNLSAHDVLETEHDQLLSLAALVPQFEHAFGLYMANKLGDVVAEAFDPERVRTATTALVRDIADPAQVASDVAVNEAAQAFFTQNSEGSWVGDYVQRRGLGQIETFGYARPGWTTLCEHLRSRGFTDEQMCAAGVAVRTASGTLIDRFRDRLMMPVRDPYGQLVAFFGRAAQNAGERTPKYLNSPATAAYTKGDALFGLDG